ncbi:Aste57867_8096 [Aphanomyces stellatus]|uniref:Aste57867_8096 protein n=1 Tax=Aphanomyces stellatus TaxID=120398 RepID=A0A485KJC7_9STRA|nr:hypothetical protein As57867_008066 [Aphanomyces stellatus]VFT84985.1 Aste57867_8096 [Aphanomyces stellatus]
MTESSNSGVSVETAEEPKVPFGTVLGITDGGVHVYNCDYTTLGPLEKLDRGSFKNEVDGVTTGYKWQCVELGRRYLLLNHGVIYDNIAMAYDIFRLKTVRRVADGQLVPMSANANGESTDLPTKGSLLIWNPVGEFVQTGHIAVIVDVTDSYVDIVEQNVDDTVWPEGQHYSRRLRAELDDATGAYTIVCSFPDSSILGWMNVDIHTEYNYEDVPRATPTQDLHRHVVTLTPEQLQSPWMDSTRPYVRTFQAHFSAALASSSSSAYFSVTSRGQAALEYATDHLHHMFLDATDYVLHHEKELGHHFRLPAALWPRIRRSWFRRKPDILAGRFDFTLTDTGIKVYEYNADSASCLMECGYNQDAWAAAAHLPGRSNSNELFSKLTAAWIAKTVIGPLHLLCDADPEELYHTEYMKAAAEAAGLTCHVVVGLATLARHGYVGNKHDIVDGNGVVLQNVWKTWSWRTAINELSDAEWNEYVIDDVADPKDLVTPKLRVRAQSESIKLIDVLLHPTVRIFEPLWTVLPSSKAILPVLTQLYPNHPMLLHSSFDLTPDLQASGYVQKPVAGRAGENVSIVAADGRVLVASEGKWADDTPIYQELALLPKFDDGKSVQLGTWAVNGAYGGTVVRSDDSHIIRMNSDVYALRVLDE